MRIGLPGAGGSDGPDRPPGRTGRGRRVRRSLWYAERGRRRPARRDGPRRPGHLADRARHLGAADLHLPPRASRPTRAAAVADAIGTPGRCTLGVGPSHQPVIEGMLGLSYATAGRHTEEYVQVLASSPAGRAGELHGEQFRVELPARRPLPDGTASLSSSRRSGRACCGSPAAHRRHDHLDGQRHGHRVHVAPAHRARPRRAPGGRRRGSSPGSRSPSTTTSPRLGRVAAEQFAMYGTLPNYQRILDARRRRAARPTPPSSATRRASPPSSRRCSRRAPPTSGPRPSPSATTARRRAARTRGLLKDLVAA